MGSEYFAVNHHNKTVFEFGSTGPWWKLRDYDLRDHEMLIPLILEFNEGVREMNEPHGIPLEEGTYSPRYAAKIVRRYTAWLSADTKHDLVFMDNQTKFHIEGVEHPTTLRKAIKFHGYEITGTVFTKRHED